MRSVRPRPKDKQMPPGENLGLFQTSVVTKVTATKPPESRPVTKR
ncbi:hypothetical protein ABIE49_006465 [Bradyrhizobium sp. OAE829]